MIVDDLDIKSRYAHLSSLPLLGPWVVANDSPRMATVDNLCRPSGSHIFILILAQWINSGVKLFIAFSYDTII